MPTQAPLYLYVDVANKALVRSFADASPASIPALYFADECDVVVYGVQRTGDVRAPLEYATLDGSLVLTLGRVLSIPSAGTFKLTYGAATTSELAWDATEENVQAALNALSTIAAIGGVTVTELSSGSWSVFFNNVGARSHFTATLDDLYPPSLLSLQEVKVGTTLVRSIQALRLVQVPTSASAWTATDDGHGWRTSLNLKSANVYEMLAGAASINNACLELTQTVDGKPSTLLQQSGVTIKGKVRSADVVTAALLDVGYPDPAAVAPAPRVARVANNGNDATASVGGSPYLTAQAAYDAIAPLARANGGQLYQIQPGLGGFGNIIDHAHDWPANLSIRGLGVSASSMGAIQMRGRNIFLTLLDCFVASVEAQGSTSLGVLAAGSVSLRGNATVGTVDVSFTGAAAANPTSSVAAGHINLNGSLEVDTANANAVGGDSTGASAGGAATGGTISVTNGVKLTHASANADGGASASGKGGDANGGLIDIYGASTVGTAAVYAVTGAGQTGGTLTGGFLNVWGPFAYVFTASAGCNTTNEGDQVSTGATISGTMSRIDTVEINQGGVLNLEMCGYINLTLDDDASFNDLGGNHPLSIY